MKYKNGGPVTLYAAVFVPYGDIDFVNTNKKAVRQFISQTTSPKDFVIVTYDQRGTR